MKELWGFCGRFIRQFCIGFLNCQPSSSEEQGFWDGGNHVHFKSNRMAEGIQSSPTFLRCGRIDHSFDLGGRCSFASVHQMPDAERSGWSIQHSSFSGGIGLSPVRESWLFWNLASQLSRPGRTVTKIVRLADALKTFIISSENSNRTLLLNRISGLGTARRQQRLTCSPPIAADSLRRCPLHSFHRQDLRQLSDSWHRLQPINEWINEWMNAR
jgi:hypothetical protein